MNVNNEIQRIKALCTPQQIERAGGITGSGVNEITLEIALHNLNYIHDNSTCAGHCPYANHPHGCEDDCEDGNHFHVPTTPDAPCHAHWLDTSASLPEQLFAMLKQDFRWYITDPTTGKRVEQGPMAGFEYSPEE